MLDGLKLGTDFRFLLELADEDFFIVGQEGRLLRVHLRLVNAIRENKQRPLIPKEVLVDAALNKLRKFA